MSDKPVTLHLDVHCGALQLRHVCMLPAYDFRQAIIEPRKIFEHHCRLMADQLWPHVELMLKESGQ